MEHIIQQILRKVGKEITEKIFEDLNDIDLMTEHVKELCVQAGKDIIVATIKKLNADLRDDKELRKEKGLVIKEKNRKRELLTAIGLLTFERDYYYNKLEEKYETPIDTFLGVPKSHRVGDSVKASLVTAATSVSYAKSSEKVCDGAVSRQSVRNFILEMDTKETPIPDEKKSVKELHLFADEDHVHMQKPNKAKGKSNKIVPLVVVTEGIEQVSKSRRRTINAKAFVDEEFKGKDLWKTVEAYITKTYELDDLEKIYIHGDGGKWIKNGLESFSNAIHIMDEFHIEKYIKKLSNAFPGRSLSQRIHSKIKANDKSGVDRILQELYTITDAKDRKRKDKIKEVGEYLLRNWDAIYYRKTLNIPGSCTEGQVSHILSERFSRNPMGWSVEGLSKLSMDRVYVLNKGKITSKDFKVKKEKTTRLKEYPDIWDKEILSKNFDWSIFEQTTEPMNQNSGTQALVHSLGEMKQMRIS